MVEAILLNDWTSTDYAIFKALANLEDEDDRSRDRSIDLLPHIIEGEMHQSNIKALANTETVKRWRLVSPPLAPPRKAACLPYY